MSRRFPGLFLMTSLCLTTGAAAPGEPATRAAEPTPGKAEPTRTDSSGDPLPPGGVRLGSTRLFHPDVKFLTFSPDGKMLASLGMSGHMHLWEVTSGKELQHFRTPRYRGWDGSLVPVAFSPDTKLIALGCADKTVHVWETATGKERHTFAGLPGQMTQLQFHPDGRYLAAGGSGGSVQILDLQQDKALEPRGDFKGIGFLAHSSDGKSLVALAYQNDWRKRIVCRWGTDGKELARAGLETGGRYLGALSPDGMLFAAPTPQGDSIRLLDPFTGAELCRTQGKTKGPGLISFSPDGKTLTASDDGTVRVWETRHGKLLHQFKAISTRINPVALSAGGKRVALAGRADGSIHVYDAKGEELHTFPGHRGGPLMVAFSPDSKTVFTVSRDSIRSLPVSEWADWSFRQWDPATGKELRVTTGQLGGEVHWTCFSGDGRLLATITHEATLRLWDTGTGAELRRWKVPTRTYTINKDNYLGQHIWHPAFAPDGKSLVAASGAKGYRWDVNTGKPLPSLDLPGGIDFPRCVPGPDDRMVVAMQWSGSRSRMDLLDATSGRILRSLGGVSGPYPACTFSPDGYTFAVADDAFARKTYSVTLLEIASGRERLRLKHASRVSALAFSPDGKLLATGDDVGVRLFHAASGRAVARVAADRELVDSLAFSPDGKWLAVGGWANTALVCDLAGLTAGKMPAAVQLNAKELDALYDDLKSGDGSKAYLAVTRLAASGKESTPFLKERLKSEPRPDEGHIAKLVADLDSDSFDVREEATAALERLGSKAEAALTRALKKTESAEARVRAQRLLDKFKDPRSPLPSNELVRLRVLEALVNSGTAEARDLIKELAKGEPDSALAQEAKAALKRWDRRPPPSP